MQCRALCMHKHMCFGEYVHACVCVEWYNAVYGGVYT